MMGISEKENEDEAIFVILVQKFVKGGREVAKLQQDKPAAITSNTDAG